MIVLKLQQRLGNQMFQYAYAFAAARRLKTNFYLDANSHGNKLSPYFRLRNFENIRNRFAPKREGLKIVQQTGFDDPNVQIGREKDRSYYEGYFQSEQYFAKYRPRLLKLFDLKLTLKKRFKKAFGSLFKSHPTLVMHVRRTDYFGHGNESLGGTNITLPLRYYRQFLAQRDFENHQKFVIGDDLEFIRDNFGHLRNIIIEPKDEITDFQLMLHADVICTANSSFSWWGAWLNKNPNKLIYVPNYWLGFKAQTEYPVGVIPDSWTRIDF